MFTNELIFEAEVNGNKEIIYRVNSKEVIRFNKPQLDDADKDAIQLLALGVFEMNPQKMTLSDAEYAEMIEKIKTGL